MTSEQISEWRIRRLIAASEKAGGDAALGTLLGHRSGAQIGHMRFGRRPVTEKTIQKIESLPGFADWFNFSASGVTTILDAAHGMKHEASSNMPLGLAADLVNTSSGPDIKGKGKYPVISNVQAGEWTELCGSFHPGDAEDFGFSHHDLGHCGYMLRVDGNSMTNTESGARYSFPHGMLLHINPDLEPLPGKFVVVRRETEKAATFKRLALVDGELFLEAINPNWPNRYLKLKPGDSFCGVVVDASFGNLP